MSATARRPTATGLDSLPPLVRDCIREWAPNASDASRFWHNAACARLDYALNQVMRWNATLNYSYTMARFLELRRNYEQLSRAAARQEADFTAEAGGAADAPASPLPPQLRELKRLLEKRLFPISFSERLLTLYMDSMRSALSPYATAFSSTSELDEKRYYVRGELIRDLFRPSLVCRTSFDSRKSLALPVN